MKPARQLSSVHPAMVLVRSVNPAIPVEFMFGCTAGTSPSPAGGADVAVPGAGEASVGFTGVARCPPRRTETQGN